MTIITIKIKSRDRALRARLSAVAPRAPAYLQLAKATERAETKGKVLQGERGRVENCV